MRVILADIPELIVSSLLPMLRRRGFTEIDTHSDYASLSEEDKLCPLIISAEEYLINKESFSGRCDMVVYIHSRQTCSRGMFSAYSSEKDVEKALETLGGPSSEVSASGECELSLREREVLCEIAKGRAYKEIADILNISVNTVLTHRKNITSKLGIRSVAGLSLYAMMNGFIK